MRRTIETDHLQRFAALFTAAVAVGALIGLVGFGPAGSDAGARIGAITALSLWALGVWLPKAQKRERLMVTIRTTPTARTTDD